ncbi:hypothetical protein AVEN_151390-1 [Araneus ventricosus]|uniref:Uncharacterized protein n=1 Tax=Araneus ventricosus TaxID=182803 RepID=A0A4Y2CA68_ARAVE|nr:hypothetical protein AVEN_151390-1 [Araneus ventricosus]
MVPTRRRSSARGIKCPTVHSGHIPVESHWAFIKQRVYATPPPTLQELQNRITDACASVSPAILYNVQRKVPCPDVYCC